MVKSIADFQRLMRIKGYSENTINVYCNALKLVQYTGRFKDWSRLDDEFLQELCFTIFTHKRMSYAYQKQVIGGGAAFLQTSV